MGPLRGLYLMLFLPLGGPRRPSRPEGRQGKHRQECGHWGNPLRGGWREKGTQGSSQAWAGGARHSAEDPSSAQPGPSVGIAPIPVPDDMGALAWVPGMGTGRPKSSDDQKGHTCRAQAHFRVLWLDEQKALETSDCLSAMVPLASPRFLLTCGTGDGVHRGLIFFLLLQAEGLRLDVEKDRQQAGGAC